MKSIKKSCAIVFILSAFSAIQGMENLTICSPEKKSRPVAIESVEGVENASFISEPAQLLSSLDQITQKVENVEYKENNLASSYRELQKAIHKGTDPVDPTFLAIQAWSLKEFEYGKMGNAHQFLCTLIKHLGEQDCDKKKADIADLFALTTQCTEFHVDSNYFSAPIMRTQTSLLLNANSNHTSLKEVLDDHFSLKEATIDTPNGEKNGERQLFITSTPEYLIIGINRNGCENTKALPFPLSDLSLKNYYADAQRDKGSYTLVGTLMYDTSKGTYLSYFCHENTWYCSGYGAINMVGNMSEIAQNGYHNNLVPTTLIYKRLHQEDTSQQDTASSKESESHKENQAFEETSGDSSKDSSDNEKDTEENESSEQKEENHEAEQEESKKSLKITYPPKPLHNSGNDCFINAVLQALHPATDLVSTALDLSKFGKENGASKLYKEFEEAYRDTDMKADPSALHEKMAELLGIKRGEQDEANYCLSVLLTQLTNSDIKDDYKVCFPLYKDGVDHKTRLSQLFFIHGQGIRSYSEEDYSEKKDPEYMLGITAQVKKGDKDLKTCLDRYFSDLSEKFSIKEDTLVDGTCKRYVKKMSQYVIVMLDRKSCIKNEKGVEYIRHDEPIAFPLEKLDFSQYFKKKKKCRGTYELISVIMHSGSANGGHYTTYNKIGNQWYYCDDSTIITVSDEDMLNLASNGYGGNNTIIPTTFIYQTTE